MRSLNKKCDLKVYKSEKVSCNSSSISLIPLNCVKKRNKEKFQKVFLLAKLITKRSYSYTHHLGHQNGSPYLNSSIQS